MFDLLKKIADKSVDDPEKSALGSAKFGSLSQLYGFIGNLVMAVAFSLSIVSLAYGCVLLITSTGDPKGAQKAYTYIMYSVVAGIASLLMYALRTVFFNTVGVDPGTQL